MPIEDGKTGYIVTPGDSEETAHAIEKLLKSKEIRNEIGRNARDKVTDLFDWEKSVCPYEFHIFGKHY